MAVVALESGCISPAKEPDAKRTIPHLANNHNSTPTQPQLNHNDRGADLPRIILAWRGGGVTGGEERQPLEKWAFRGACHQDRLRC